MFIAVRKKDHPAIELLIQNGADVNARDKVRVYTFHSYLEPLRSTKDELFMS